MKEAQAVEAISEDESDEPMEEEESKDVTVVVEGQGGSKTQVTVNHTDLQDHASGAFVSLLDLAYYLIKFEIVPTELGMLIPADPVKIYLDAEMRTANGQGTTRLPTIGKQPQAAATNMKNLPNNETLHLKARIPTVPKASHPEWLIAKQSKETSPTPKRGNDGDLQVTHTAQHAHTTHNGLRRACRVTLTRKEEPQALHTWTSTKPKPTKLSCKPNWSTEAKRTCPGKTLNKAKWSNNNVNNYNKRDSVTFGHLKSLGPTVCEPPPGCAPFDVVDELDDNRHLIAKAIRGHNRNMRGKSPTHCLALQWSGRRGRRQDGR